MNQDSPNHERTRPADVVTDIIHEVGDEIAAVVAVPGEITYRTLNRFFEFIGNSGILFTQALGYVLRGSLSMRGTVAQIATIGVDSLPLVLVTVAFSGMVLALYSAQTLVDWGFGSLVGRGVALSVVREIGPVLTAVVVAARSGSGMAAEIGTMKVTEQIDALRALAISPVEYLVSPRLVAAIIALPILTIFADVIGVVAGYYVAVINGVAGGSFISDARSYVVPHDINMGLIKTVVFGAVIAIVGCQEGLQTTGGASGVGRSTTNAVVISVVLIYILNFFMAYVMFGGRTGAY
ncbi:MAG: ABC transporter permease [Armatimonadota bacterium]|nr:ABC transporter permease [Armatimonadota bacterium]